MYARIGDVDHRMWHASIKRVMIRIALKVKPKKRQYNITRHSSRSSIIPTFFLFLFSLFVVVIAAAFCMLLVCCFSHHHDRDHQQSACSAHMCVVCMFHTRMPSLRWARGARKNLVRLFRVCVGNLHFETIRMILYSNQNTLKNKYFELWLNGIYDERYELALMDFHRGANALLITSSNGWCVMIHCIINWIHWSFERCICLRTARAHWSDEKLGSSMRPPIWSDAILSRVCLCAYAAVLRCVCKPAVRCAVSCSPIFKFPLAKANLRCREPTKTGPLFLVGPNSVGESIEAKRMAHYDELFPRMATIVVVFVA